MPLESLTATVTLLIALSMATERAVDIVKSLVPWLDSVKSEPALEGRRRAAIQALAVVFGLVIAAFTWPIAAQVVTANGSDPSRNWATIGALGFLASGGSAFWNSLLGIVLSLKVLKSAEAKKETVQNNTATVIPHPEEGQLALSRH